MLMHLLAIMVLLVSALTPTRMWFPPKQPVTVDVKAQGDAALVLRDFNGKPIVPKESAEVSGDKNVDLAKVFPQIATVGTYVLYVVPKGKPPTEFEGTPLVIETRADRRHGVDAVVIKAAPLRYATM